MYCQQISFPPKHPLDDITLEFNFSEALPPGDVLASVEATPSIRVLAGVDAAPEAVLGGLVAFLSDDALAILVRITGGVPGVSYLITVRGTWGLDAQAIAMDGYFTVLGG